jgi:hypothetical protein
MEIILTTEEWRVVLLGLQELPAKQSYGLIEKIIKEYERSQSSLSQASSDDGRTEGGC